MATVRRFGPSIPILGVCLGHQSIGQAFGGRVVRARRPMHGKTSTIRHNGGGIFAGLPNPLRATRYHSLVVAKEDLPEELVITAESDQGEIMALAHRRHPIVGLQFHPEAVLTEHGHDLLRNFLGKLSHRIARRRIDTAARTPRRRISSSLRDFWRLYAFLAINAPATLSGYEAEDRTEHH